jgi:plasmid stabilization system protein ParE
VISASFHSDAERELDEAVTFYESRVPGLGKAFFVEIERIVRLLRQYPGAGAPAGAKRRRVLVDRFPYFIAYERSDDSIVILAVGHQKRRPGYWRKRG